MDRDESVVRTCVVVAWGRSIDAGELILWRTLEQRNQGPSGDSFSLFASYDEVSCGFLYPA